MIIDTLPPKQSSVYIYIYTTQIVFMLLKYNVHLFSTGKRRMMEVQSAMSRKQVFLCLAPKGW